MHILILSELFYPHGGGAELATYLYAKLLSKRPGIKITVVTNRVIGESAYSEDEGFSVYRLSLLKGESVKYSILQRIDVLLSSFLRKLVQKSDVVYIPRFWFSAILLAKKCRKPVITHLHDYIPICPLAVRYDSTTNDICNHRGVCDPSCIYTFERQKRTLRSTLGSTVLNLSAWTCLRKVVEHSDAVICVSKAHRRILVENNRKLESTSTVVYNPLPNLTQIPINGEAIGYFGGLSLRKGLPILKKAVTLVKNRSTRKAVVHATKLEGISEHLALELKQQGFLLHSKLSRDDYMRMYENVRTVVVPSVWPEPWPYVVVEALVNGRLILASNIGGISEQLEDCRGVTLIEPGNPEALAQAIVSARELDKEHIVEFGYHNRENFLKKFSTEKSIDKFIRICERLV